MDSFNEWNQPYEEENRMGGEFEAYEEGTLYSASTSNSKPCMYQVIVLNDDYTPMDFVVHVIEKFFNQDGSDAESLMLEVHNRGEAVCGTYTRDIAETKVISVMDFARVNHHPLRCVMQKSEDYVVKKS